MSNRVPSFLVNTYSSFMNNDKLSGIKVEEKPGEAATAIFYINDIHGSKAERYKSAGDYFTKTSSPQCDTFKLCAGDTNIGGDKNKNNMLIQALNLIGIDLSAVGNHEMDIGTETLAKEMNNAKYKFVTSNLNIRPDNELVSAINSNKLVSSTIINRNGHNYGFIGACPTDLIDRVSHKELLHGISVDDMDNTIKDLQEEVNNLKAKGVNKIVLISHLGYKKEIEVAKNVSGIDIIIGGHSHDVIDGVTQGTNLFYSPTGEPVVITQGGKDGDYYGIVNLVFDSNGMVKAAGNKLNRTNIWPKDPGVEAIKDKTVGPAIPIGTIANKCQPEDVLTQENPIASLICDSIRYKTGAQIALINSGTTRGGLEAGTVTTRDIQELIPFTDNVNIAIVSEKDIIDALNNGAKSTAKAPFKPGVMQVSGLKYTITPNKTVKDVYMENPDGSLTKLNSSNPDPNKKFTAAYRDFLVDGHEGFDSLKRSANEVQKFNWTAGDATVEYIKAFANRSIPLQAGNRIVIEK